MSDSFCNPVDCSPLGSSVQGDSPGKNTGVGCHALFQGIFPAQGLNPSLLYCRWILYHLSHQGSPSILDWATYPFSRGSSWPRNWTGVSSITCKLFTNWAIREAQCSSRSTNWYKLSEKALGKKQNKTNLQLWLYQKLPEISNLGMTVYMVVSYLGLLKALKTMIHPVMISFP